MGRSELQNTKPALFEISAEKRESRNSPRTDLHDLAITNTLVRLHFDKFGSLELKVQTHLQTLDLFH